MSPKSILTIAAVSFALAATCLQAQTIKATINTPQPTAGIAANPLLNRIYVVEPSFGGATDTLAVINGKTNTIVNNITIPAGAYLPAVNYLTGRVYITTCNSNVDPIPCSVIVVDALKNKVISTIPITTTQGDGLLGIAVNLLTNKIYVSNASDLVVDIIDGCTNKVTGTLPITGGEPVGLATNSFLNTLYVPLGDGTVDVFDTKKNVLTTTSTVGSVDSFAAVNLATGNVFVSNAVAGPSTTEVVDKTGVSLASVPVGDTPYGLDVDPITNLAFVSSTALNNVTVIDGKTNTVKNTVLNVQASFISVNYVTALVYVSGATGVTVLTEK